MKNLITCILAFSPLFSLCQNVGIGTPNPIEKLHVTGNLIAGQPYVNTSASPTPPQMITMVNGNNITVPKTDSTVFIYDTGGPAGGYQNNVTAKVYFTTFGQSGPSYNGFEIALTDISLNTGDSLIINDDNGNPWLAVGNGYSTEGKYLFGGTELEIIFKSNNDGLVGKGFKMLVKRLYSVFIPGSQNPGIGNNLFFDASKGALRFGAVTANNITRGSNSIAAGEGMASGVYSVALGGRSDARGPHSLSIGDFTTASGLNSIALGFRATANANYSTAIGRFVSTNSKEGSFVLGDASTLNYANSQADNSFTARFAGGYRLFTNADMTLGAILNPGQNSWAIISDVHKKENLSPVNAEELLEKIGNFNLVSWNYKGQDPRHFRHYGPMAQDFYHAFGKDGYGVIGNDTTINQADFDGINFIAIHALEKRTVAQKQTIHFLLNEIEKLKANEEKLLSEKKEILARLGKIELWLEQKN